MLFDNELEVFRILCMPPIYLLSPLLGRRCAGAVGDSAIIMKRGASSTKIGRRIASIVAERRLEVELPTRREIKSPRVRE